MTAPAVASPEALQPIASGETAGVPHLVRLIPGAADLFSTIRNAAATDERETAQRLDADSFLLRAREGALHEREQTIKLHETLAAIATRMERGELGRVGAEQATIQAQQALASEQAKVDASGQHFASAFLSSYRESRLPAPTPDVATAVTIATTIFENARAESYLEHLAGILARAVDPNETAAERTRANQTLDAQLPLLDRRVNRPEGHAADSARAAGDLHFLVVEHLDVLLGRRRAAAARELADTVANERAWIRAKMNALGGWDDTYARLAGRTLFRQQG